jgi:hypothetical protein
MADELEALKQELAHLERDLAEAEGRPMTAWEQRLAEATPAPYTKHIKARTEAEARTISETGDSQYLPGIGNTALELEALRHGQVTRGDPNSATGTVHVEYDAGRVIGYDGGKPVTTMRGELTTGNKYHGHPRKL